MDSPISEVSLEVLSKKKRNQPTLPVAVRRANPPHINRPLKAILFKLNIYLTELYVEVKVSPIYNSVC